jgi:hypothetical protein
MLEFLERVAEAIPQARIGLRHKKTGGWIDPGRRVQKIRFVGRRSVFSLGKRVKTEDQIMPSTMAPTKAKARYAVTTPNLLTKGRNAILKPPKVTSLPATTH